MSGYTGNFLGHTCYVPELKTIYSGLGITGVDETFKPSPIRGLRSKVIIPDDFTVWPDDFVPFMTVNWEDLSEEDKKSLWNQAATGIVQEYWGCNLIMTSGNITVVDSSRAID